MYLGNFSRNNLCPLAFNYGKQHALVIEKPDYPHAHLNTFKLVFCHYIAVNS